MDATKYLDTANLGRSDTNKLGWKLGDIFHTCGYVTANQYNYCGYDEIAIPLETPVRIIGIKQTTLNAELMGHGGDMYVDYECVDLKNEDGTPVTLGNRHYYSLLEASPNHKVCPDDSGDLGMVRDGIWRSYAGTSSVNSFGQHEFSPNKIINLYSV